MEKSNIYLKLNALKNNQRQTYMTYINDLEKLPTDVFQKLHSKLIDILYDHQTTKVDIDIDQIRTHLAMSNFPSYAVNENDVAKEIARLEEVAYKKYRENLKSFEKELNLAKIKLLADRDKVLDKILKTYVDFTISEEKSYKDFYKKIEKICDDNSIINLDTYLN